MSGFLLTLACVVAAGFVLWPLLRHRGDTQDDADVDRQMLLRELHAQRNSEVTDQADAELRQALADEMDTVRPAAQCPLR